MEVFRTKTFKKDYQRIKLTDAPSSDPHASDVIFFYSYP